MMAALISFPACCGSVIPPTLVTFWKVWGKLEPSLLPNSTEGILLTAIYSKRCDGGREVLNLRLHLSLE